jgi:hypothetical protein
MHIKPQLTCAEERQELPRNKIDSGSSGRVLRRIVPHDFFVRGLASSWCTEMGHHQDCPVMFDAIRSLRPILDNPHPPTCSEGSLWGPTREPCMFSAFDSGSECQITSRSTIDSRYQRGSMWCTPFGNSWGCVYSAQQSVIVTRLTRYFCFLLSIKRSSNTRPVGSIASFRKDLHGGSNRLLKMAWHFA